MTKEVISANQQSQPVTSYDLHGLLWIIQSCCHIILKQIKTCSDLQMSFLTLVLCLWVPLPHCLLNKSVLFQPCLCNHRIMWITEAIHKNHNAKLLSIILLDACPIWCPSFYISYSRYILTSNQNWVHVFLFFWMAIPPPLPHQHQHHQHHQHHQRWTLKVDCNGSSKETFL